MGPKFPGFQPVNAAKKRLQCICTSTMLSFSISSYNTEAKIISNRISMLSFLICVCRTCDDSDAILWFPNTLSMCCWSSLYPACTCFIAIAAVIVISLHSPCVSCNSSQSGCRKALMNGTIPKSLSAVQVTVYLHFK